MTYHLASLRLRSIGERSARFTDLTLDLTSPAGPAGLSNVPSDSIVWLRNGGGKSSLLSLFYALLLPHANDFMGRAVKRSLTDYVDSGDTSHTIAVWHPADRPTLLGDPERVLITGAIYEWTELRRPADPDKDRDRLVASYYAFFAVPGVVDATSLPLLGADGQPLRRAAVLAALRELAVDHASAMDLVLPRNQREWTDELQARGIDPELYRRQKEMNHVEGGVEDLFRFASAREFIDFLLDLTVPPDEVTPVADRLAKIADLLSTRPAKVAERDFCRDVAITLARISAADDGLRSASADLAAADAEAGRCAGRFAATAQAARQSVAELAGQLAALEDIHRQAERDRDEASELEFLYRHLAATLRVQDAEEAHQATRLQSQAAAQLVAAWRLTGSLAEQHRLISLLDQVKADAGAERERTAPLRTARDLRAAALMSRLHRLADVADAEAATARAQISEQEQIAQQRAEAMAAARAELSEATQDMATAKTHLGELDRQLLEAVASGLLPAPGADPQQEHDQLAGRLQESQRQLDAIRQARAGRPNVRRAATERLHTLNTERAQLDTERSRALADLAGFEERARELAGDPRIRDLAEATAQAPVDLWSEAPALLGRLFAELRRHDEQLIRIEAIRLDEERSLDAQARTGLLPTSLDAARVCATLTERGISAEPGWTHVRDNWPADRLGDLLTHPDLARLGCGVVVPTGSAQDAAEVLAALDEVTTALVEVFPASTAELLMSAPPGEQEARRPVWRGLNPGLVDGVTAEKTVAAIRARQATDNAGREVVRLRRDADRRLCDQLAALSRDCPEGLLDTLAARIGEYDAALEQTGQAMDVVRGELERLELADQADAAQELQLTDISAALSRSLVQVRALADRSADAPRWRELFGGAQRRQSDAAEDERRHAVIGQQARDAAASARAVANDRARDAAAHRAEAAGVTFLDAQPAARDDEHVPLDTIRDLYREADLAYQQNVSDSVLAEREQNCTAQLAKVTAELARAERSARDQAETLLASTLGQSEQARTRALADAEEARRQADADAGRAEGSVTAAQQALVALESRRALPVRAIPAGAASAAAADQMADLHALTADQAKEAVSAAQQQVANLGTARDRLLERAGAFELLMEGLPLEHPDQPGQSDQPGQLGEPFEGDQEAARVVRRAAIDALGEVKERHAAAEKAFSAAIHAVRLAGGRYPTIGTPAKDRIMNDSEAVLARTADDLASNLTLRATMIDDELAGIAEDQAIITASLAHLVSDTLDTLRKAERYSRLPASMGLWAGKQMLRISFDPPASDADLAAHMDRVIERCIEDGLKPQGLPLLKQAVHEAAGPRGFRVKVLKPAQEVSPTSEDITRLGKWSGGEKLTVCVAIYCTLAALRARNTGKGNAAGGVLVLDNPIGRASHGSLVRLQRDVAAAHGVQLVYTTGVKDPDAVSRFPNVIRLDNRPGRTRSRRYIVPSDPASSAPDEQVRTVIGTRVAHLEAADEPG
jgi:hypothetical protein